MSKEYIINEYVRNFDDLIDVIHKIGREYEELQERVGEKGTIEDLNYEIINLEDKLSDEQDDNMELRAEITVLKKEISNLEKEIENLKIEALRE